jgi:hypothetical protein
VFTGAATLHKQAALDQAGISMLMAGTLQCACCRRTSLSLTCKAVNGMLRIEKQNSDRTADLANRDTQVSKAAR